MEKITLKELYDLIVGEDLVVKDRDGDLHRDATQLSIENVFSELEKRGLTK